MAQVINCSNSFWGMNYVLYWFLGIGGFSKVPEYILHKYRRPGISVEMSSVLAAWLITELSCPDFEFAGGSAPCMRGCGNGVGRPSAHLDGSMGFTQQLTLLSTYCAVHLALRRRNCGVRAGFLP